MYFVQLATSKVRTPVCVFGALVISSLGLKAVVGPPQDGFLSPAAGGFEQRASAILRAQGFSTRDEPFASHGTLILGQRGNCRVAVRSAMGGSGFARVFAAEVKDVGQVVYLFRNERYATPPELKMRISRLQTELLNRLGSRPSAPIVVAFAASPGCPASGLGFEDLRIR